MRPNLKIMAFVAVLACATVGSAQLFEDFQGGVWPAGWVRQNLDGRTPASAVAEYTEAWNILDVNSDGNFVAGSTSWYSPAGAANDWMITPSVTPTTGWTLSWTAMAPDGAYPDGYVVYYSTTTQDSVGCLANPPLLTIPAEAQAWTSRSVDLTFLAGTPAYFCFRNNSNDMFLLWIDDIRVNIAIDYDLVLSSVTNPHQYGWVPTLLAPSFTLSGDVTNNGQQALTNVKMTATVNHDGTIMPPIDSNTVASLAPTASDVLTAPPLSSLTGGAYTITYAASMTETDEVPANNGAQRVHVVTDGYVSRTDWDSIAGSVGFGNATGHFGTMFDTGQTLEVQGVDFAMQGLTTGVSYNAYLWSWDSGTGEPITITATSDPFVRTADAVDYVYVEFPGGPITVGPQFFVSVYEPGTEPVDESIGVWYSDHVYTPGTLFYKVDGDVWTETGFNFTIGVQFASAANTAPVVVISSPTDPTTVTQFDLVTFTGTATDTEDGDLTASLSWTSNLDGPIGTGATFGTTTLSVGTHVITAAVTDSGALPGSDTVTVTVNADPDFIFANGFESGNLSGWSNNTP